MKKGGGVHVCVREGWVIQFAFTVLQIVPSSAQQFCSSVDWKSHDLHKRANDARNL